MKLRSGSNNLLDRDTKQMVTSRSPITLANMNPDYNNMRTETPVSLAA